MKKIFVTLLLAIVPFIAFAQDITGSWNGVLEVGGQELRIVFNIEATDDGYVSTMDSPDQGARGIPVTSTSFVNGRLRIEAKDLYMMYTGALKGDVIEGKFTQMGMSHRMDLKRGGVEKASRPQTPVPPYTYNIDEVKFENPEAGITLAGTFTYPKEGSGFSAVILLSGTGAQNRDEEIIDHKTFLVLADYLTRHGIAVLRFDDRGTGESGGDFASATLMDLASDGSAGVDWLRCRAEVDSSKVGIIGHSGGGTQAIMIAAERDDVAFIVMLAGATVRGDVMLAEQRRLLSEVAGTPESARLENEELVAKMQSVIDKYGIEEVRANPELYVEEAIPATFKSNPAVTKDMLAGAIAGMANPELQSLIKYDPTADLGRIKCPVLALNGEKDLQVAADMNLGAVEKYVKSNATVKKYPGLNHLFQHAETGSPAEYGIIEETMSPEVLADIVEWVQATSAN